MDTNSTTPYFASSRNFSVSDIIVIVAYFVLNVAVGIWIVTMPEYLGRRFGGERIRMYLSALSLLLSVFTKISTDLYSGALFVQVCLGWNLYVSTVLMLVVTALYTIAGGLAAVIYTDTLQTFIMIIGAIILTITGGLAAVIYTDTLQTFIMIIGAIILTITAFNKIDGYHNLEKVYLNAIPAKIIPNTTCHLPRADAMHLFRDPVAGDLPWTGMTFGLTILATWQPYKKYICLSLTAFNKIDGYHNLEKVYLNAIPAKIIPNTTCHLPRADAMHLFRDPVAGDLPWTGMTFGLTILATWYWCTDQASARLIYN
ncbi:UNVERIFIED_CONTAM: hypothetical protein FKN15_032907 [Acipenser sinensis]